MSLISGGGNGGGLFQGPSPQVVAEGTDNAQGRLEVTYDGGTENIDLSVGGGGQATEFLTGTSAQVFRFDDAGGTNAVGLTHNGVEIWVHTAPADGDLSAGQLVLWFDQTNGAGATKLMVKAKSADGTVKTGAVVLA